MSYTSNACIHVTEIPFSREKVSQNVFKNKPVRKNAVGYGFLASLQSTFRLTVCAYLNTQKYGLLSQSVKIILFLPVFLQGPTSMSLQKSKKPENKTGKLFTARN